jgi:hypothetical protein
LGEPRQRSAIVGEWDECPEAKQAMLNIAENYDRLAKIAEAQEAGVLSKPMGGGGNHA